MIEDYITGRQLRETPEERSRQALEEMLVDSWGYPKEHMTIEFPIQRGSQSGREKADIAIFRSDDHAQTNLLAIVETKAPGEVLDDQAFSYVTATTAEFVIWFDGLERDRSQGLRHFWRDMRNDPTTFIQIPNFPAYNETLESIGHISKGDLRPVRNIRGVLRRLHNRLYSEGPLKREADIAHEIIKVLFCKLFDELDLRNEYCSFRATVDEMQTAEGHSEIADRIRGLFGRLQSDRAYSGMFGKDELRYEDRWIAYIVSELQLFGLTHPDTSIEAMGDAYEVFIGPQLKGESGQFFTPRAVVRMAVEMLNPSIAKRESIIDPACGSGGFLSYALRHVTHAAESLADQEQSGRAASSAKEYASNFIHGIEIDELLYRVAKSYMALMGDGQAGIYRADALADPASESQLDQDRVSNGSFDVVLTNPPFGSRIKVETRATLNRYDLAFDLEDVDKRGDQISGGQEPAILFLERCHQLLKLPEDGRPGGRMAIVLPRQILNGHDKMVRNIRRWILSHFRILAVVDLPPETFQPFTGTVTSVLFAEKIPNITHQYTIFMGIVGAVGHDRRGEPLVLRDESGEVQLDDQGRPTLLDDTGKIAELYASYQTSTEVGDETHSAFTVSSREILETDDLRLDASYYAPQLRNVADRTWRAAHERRGIEQVRRLGELVVPRGIYYPGRHKRNYCDPGDNAVPFLSGTNILQSRAFGVKWQPHGYKPISATLVEEGWILVTRSGSVGRVVYVGSSLAGFLVRDGVAVSEHVIRVRPNPTLVDPGYVYAFLASSDGTALLSRGTYASVVQHLTPEHIGSIPIPLPAEENQRRIGDEVRRAHDLAWQASSVDHDAIREVETALGTTLFQ
ncbi:MAG: N-6 DNA methylase [Acidimicrobiales bacterium]|nr:N-6 DNA methylase [Acidimicrobiaceae bacterium]MXV87360.1 N-6 DNA methylase [Acidimicrobiales bacterium]MYB81175.1 N-6 DNA methylase [Acidimicrobiales bacterium]MYI11940.1 N-6 DNA methylase [Acidimicrobiales bacterium]